MANKSVTTYLRTLGVPASEAGNRYYYGFNSPLTNMFTGIKYVISRTGQLLDTETVKEIDSEGDVRMYENKYTLPIGFMTDENILKYDGTNFSNPFDAQNDLFAKATGITEPLFTSFDVTHTAHSGFSSENGVYKKNYGSYTFKIDEEADEHKFAFNFVPEKESVLYAYFACDGISKVNILNNSVETGSYSVTKQQGYIAPIGTFKAGEKATVSAKITDESVKRGNLTIYVCSINLDALNKAYSKLLEGGVKLESFSDREMSGTVNASEDGVCFFSIPDDGSWTAYVDGEKVDTETVGGAMISVPVKAGEHTIKLKYTPEGFKEGIVLTIAGLAILTAVFLFERRRKETIR